MGTLVMVMAGGKGSRLGPLTVHRAKPAVPFAGRYRIIDFVLSNILNSGYRQVFVLTQYMATSLIRHLSSTWHLSGGIREFIEIVPAQMRHGEHWYLGTADAISQNLNLILDSRAEHVAIFGGDHIYKFAIDQMEARHRQTSADLTIAAFPVPRSQAHQFGVLQVDEQWRIVGFQEKPADPQPIPGKPDTCLVSMGNYFFRASVLTERLRADSADPGSNHDFGKDIIPGMVRDGLDVRAYDCAENAIPGEPEDAQPYWRDVGTLDSYFEANMEIRSPLPAVNLYNREWRIRGAQRDYPPARLVRHLPFGHAVQAIDSLLCEGSIVASATLQEVMLGYDSWVHRGAEIGQSVILSGCDIGSSARLHRVLMDKNCVIAPGAEIGVEPERDRERFPFVTDSGIVVIPKGSYVPPSGPLRLATDMADLIHKDPALAAQLKAFKGDLRVRQTDRHSHFSAGPRYRRFDPEGD